MNKFIFISVLLLVPFLSMAQTNYPDSLKQDITKVEITDSLKIDSNEYSKYKQDLVINEDSLMKANISEILYLLKKQTPRFKMYETENINILLKLDTATGEVWMVQRRVSYTPGAVIPISSGLIFMPEGDSGRYELYPTGNMYTFIMIDTLLGLTYQVQWSTESEYRFIERLY